eukprot:3524376-Alexandrium_andersonii.AAC.1
MSCFPGPFGSFNFGLLFHSCPARRQHAVSAGGPSLPPPPPPCRRRAARAHLGPAGPGCFRGVSRVVPKEVG